MCFSCFSGDFLFTTRDTGFLLLAIMLPIKGNLCQQTEEPVTQGVCSLGGPPLGGVGRGSGKG